jgi:hypothetical protein
MIVSHTHRFIFIHCRKVAGSSMKVALAPFLSGRDIVIGSLNEIIESGTAVPPQMRRILRRPDVAALAVAARLLGKSWPEAQNIAVKRHFSRQLGANPPHPPAEVAARFLGSDWDRYAKFCFVRNPFERAASDYFWRRRTTGRQFTFLEYLTALRDSPHDSPLVHADGTSNWDLISIGGRLAVDLVGRFETLEEDFASICERIGLPRLRLNAAEKSGAPRAEYGTLYGSREQALVGELFAAELAQFGYDFPY